jgi:metal-responsive CopG/Arc/MetJ family transcriptional regulator
MVEREKVQVRVELEGDLLEKFDALRKFYGVQGYAELVRILVNERHRLLQGNGQGKQEV